MRIFSVNSFINFKRELKPNEINDYKSTLLKAREIVGQTDKSIFIMPSSCLPQSKEFNTGIGHIASKKSQEYLEYMHNYLGFNIVEDLPAGQVVPFNDFYCAYNSSALALGNHQICPELLLTDEYANILTKEELAEIVNNNKIKEKDSLVNFKNVMNINSSQDKVIKKAYKRFLELDNNNDLKKRFFKFIEENKDWLNFPREYEGDLEYFKFKQFLAEEHLQKGRKSLNSKNIKLAGDCLIGFSADEVKAFPEAFKKDHFIGTPDWCLPALNYDTILDESSASNKLLKRKIQLFAKRYDVIRFDVAWAYVTPIITPSDVHSIKEENRKYMGDSLLKLIEKWVKEIKGEDFDLKNLIYEFDADPKEFKAFEGSDLIPALKNRVKIYGSTYMHNTGYDKWGYNRAFLDRGWSPDEFIIGVGNHDPQPLRQIANDIPDQVKVFSEEENKYVIREYFHKKDAIKPLSEELNIPQEKLNNPVEFAKAKFAEPMTAKNNQYFYMDVFGREERFDMQGLNTTVHPEKNYAYKVPENYQKAYHKAIQEGFGFNIMDSLEKIFVSKGYDKKHPDLYAKIVKYKNILKEKDVTEEVSTKVNETKSNIVKNKNKSIKFILSTIAGLTFLGGLFYFTYSDKNSKQKNLNTVL